MEWGKTYGEAERGEVDWSKFQKINLHKIPIKESFDGNYVFAFNLGYRMRVMKTNTDGTLPPIDIDIDIDMEINLTDTTILTSTTIDGRTISTHGDLQQFEYPVPVVKETFALVMQQAP